MSPRWEARDRFYAALAAAAAVLAFAPALRAGFVWDDQKNILENPGFRSFDARHLKWMFTTFYMGPYQPLSWLSLGLDFKLWGLKAAGFHLTNLLLHAGGAALFFALARDLLARALPGAPAHRLRLGALAGALFFAAHPLRAESVVWVTERRDVLAGFFYLAATLAYLRSRLGLAFALQWLCLMSKASGVMLPAAWLILDYYPLKRLDTKVSFYKAAAEKIPFFLLSLVFAALAVTGQASAGNLSSLSDHGIPARLAQALVGLAFYIEKTLWPARLSALYPLPKALSLLSLKAAAAALLLAAAAVVLRFCGVPRQARAALWAYYALTCLPMLGLLQNGPQLAADRFSYLSCLGWAMLAAAAAAHAAARQPAAAPIAAATLAAVLTASSWQRARDWRSEESLWEAAVKADPDSAAVRINYGLAFEGRRRLSEALAQFEKAVELEPDNPWTWTHKGYALLELEKYREAERDLRRAEVLSPDLVAPQIYLGATLLKQGRPKEALPYFRRVVELEPRSEQARDNLEAALRASALPMKK